MANLFVTKPLDAILGEAAETGTHTLKRSLGATNLITLGIGAIIGTGIFVLTGVVASGYCGPARGIHVYHRGDLLRVCRTVLRGVRGDDPGGRIGIYLWLCDARRDLCLDHRLGPGAGICVRRGDGVFGLERLCAEPGAGLWDYGCRRRWRDVPGSTFVQWQGIGSC